MTLLQQIQSEAITSHVDLPGLLRRCRILAQRLAVDDFKNWVTYELEGYPHGAPIPAYRKVPTPLILGTFTGYSRRLENAQIPISKIPEQFKEYLTTLHFSQGVAAIAEMIRGESHAIRIPWPVEFLSIIGQGDMYPDFYLAQAIRQVSVSSIREILDQIQNRILSFVLELESRNPEAGEAIMNSPKIPEEQVSAIFNTIIKGDVQNLAQASHDFSQTALAKVIPGDLNSLRTVLFQIGVPHQDIDELEAAINSDKKDGAKIGGNVTTWLGKMAVKASEVGTKVATGVGTSAIIEAVKMFFQG